MRQVEDLLYERDMDVLHETVRFWRNRFGPKFAPEIRKRVVQRPGCPLYRMFEKKQGSSAGDQIVPVEWFIGIGVGDTMTDPLTAKRVP